jgi:outer membrane protein assembly factor BamB
MAKEGPCVKCWAALIGILIVVLAFTGVLSPFLEKVWAFVSKSEPLSTPAPLWQQRLGGTPVSATIAGNTVVVEHRTLVEARSLGTGSRLWERKADWAAVTGGGGNSAVVVGKLLVKGYELLDPSTGAVIRRDSDAVAVWTYRNAMLDVRCFDARDCTLTAWDPRGTAPLWTVPMPGIGFVLFADNPDILGTEPLTVTRIAAQAGGPEAIPPMLGFPIDDKVYVVDTAAGRVLQEMTPERDERVVVVGGRALRITAESRDGTCYYGIVAVDPATGQEVWSNTGINLRTTSGAGCTQRSDPAGGRNVVVGVAPDTSEMVIDAYDGNVLWQGEPGQRLVSVDDSSALVESADGRTLIGAELRGGVRWDRPVNEKAQASLARYAAILLDERPDRLIAINQVTGAELLNVRSKADVLAVGPRGVVIGDGRDIAYVPFAGVTPIDPSPGTGGPDDPGGGDEPGTGPGPGSGPECGGPKQESCPVS